MSSSARRPQCASSIVRSDQCLIGACHGEAQTTGHAQLHPELAGARRLSMLALPGEP